MANHLDIEGKRVSISSIRDITERKKYELKIKESEEKYREAYYRENFYKDLFAHDMKNILQAIRNSFELFEYSLKNGLESAQNKGLAENIHTQINRGTHLISNISKFSELESFEESMSKLDIYKCIEQNIENMQKTYKNKGINIQLTPTESKDYIIYGNELLNEVIENILLNSIIHNDNKDVRIWIKLSKVIRDKAPYIKIEFSDNGRGIKDSMKEMIFNRAYNQNKSTVGMGLGLSLVKKIVENLKGNVSVENRVIDDYTQGSNFIILLPEVI